MTIMATTLMDPSTRSNCLDHPGLILIHFSRHLHYLIYVYRYISACVAVVVAFVVVVVVVLFCIYESKRE
jgi:hypothetical protein